MADRIAIKLEEKGANGLTRERHLQIYVPRSNGLVKMSSILIVK